MASNIVWSSFLVPNGGINETRSPHEIGDNEWEAGLDAEPMPDGVRRRQGRTRSNATAIGTDAVTMIKDYWLSDGTTQRHLIMYNGDLYKNVSGTMTKLSSATMSAGVNVFESASVGQDRCFITNGTETSVKFYVSGGTEYWEGEGIAVPTATPTAAAAAGGSLATGTWYVDYYYWNDDLSLPSNTRYDGVDTISATLTAGNQTIDITGLPTAVARTNDRATHVRINLKSPSGTVYRYAGDSEGEIAIGTSTASISSDATGDAAIYDYDVAPVHSIKCVAENRQFIAGISGFPYRVMFSYIGGTTAQYECFPPNNYRDFGKGDGDHVTALAFVPPSTLFVGCKNSLWAIDTRHPGTSDKWVLAKGVGVAGKNALTVIGRSVYFISDADQTKGPMVWDGSAVSPIYGIDDTFKSLNQSRLQYASCAHLAPGDNRFQWWSLVTSAAQSAPDRILVYDYAMNSWTVYTTSGANIIGNVRISDVNYIYIGSTNGMEYKADSGADDQNASGDDTQYMAYIKMKTLDFGEPDMLKRLRFVRYVAKEQTAGAMGVTVESDYGGKSSFSGNLPHISSSTASVLGTGTLGSFVLGSNDSNLTGRISMRGVGRMLSAQISDDNAWYLKGIAFGVQPTGRR